MCQMHTAGVVLTLLAILNSSRQSSLFNSDGDEEDDMCSSDSSGYRYCESELALCRNVPTEKGYECYCAEGKVRIDSVCKDATEVNTPSKSVTELTSPTSTLSISLSPSSGTTQNTLKTLSTSFETLTTYNFKPSIKTSQMPSSINEIPSTTLSGHDSSSLVTVSYVVDTDECSRNSCTINTTCLNLPGDFTCNCKAGFVPRNKHFQVDKYCLGNCSLSECIEICKNMECHLQQEENIPNAVIYIKRSGWPVESIIVCATLLTLLIFFVSSTAYLFIRYQKLLKASQHDEKQVVFQNMDKTIPQICDSVRENTLPDGVVVISYVFPNSKAAKGCGVPVPFSR